MGASVSRNVADVVTTSMASVTAKVLNNMSITSDQTNIIHVDHVTGDVEISGNRVTNMVKINLYVLSTTLNQADLKLQLDQNIAQAAKALISGLNLVQFSDAVNTINTTIKACIDVKDEVVQNCLLSGSQTTIIRISHVNGNVKITDNDVEQIANMLSSCVQNAASNNKTIAKVQQKLDQSAVAESQGLNLNYIAAIIIGIVVAGVGGTYAFGKVGTKLIFPVMLLGSIITFVLYFVKTKKTISSYAFEESLISTTATCEGATPGEQNHYNSPTTLSDACEASSTCTAYEWSDATKKGRMYFRPLPEACINDLESRQHKDHEPIVKKVVFVKGTVDPTTINGNVYLNTTTGKIWLRGTNVLQSPIMARQTTTPPGLSSIYGSGGIYTTAFGAGASDSEWHEIISVQKLPTARIDWGESLPSPIQAAQNHDIWIDVRDPAKLIVYRHNGAKWIRSETLLGPGNIVDVPSLNNTVGFAVNQRRTWMLVTSIGLFVVGLLGMIITNKSKLKE